MRLHRLVDMEDTRIDHTLLTKLVERWRPKTNTFHFSTGKAAVALEDIAYIYGLPINGPLVIGHTYSKGSGGRSV